MHILQRLSDLFDLITVVPFTTQRTNYHSCISLRPRSHVVFGQQTKFVRVRGVSQVIWLVILLQTYESVVATASNLSASPGR